MIRRNFLLTLLILTIQILLVNCHGITTNQIFIRTNQVGFFPQALKTSVVLSDTSLSTEKFQICDFNSGNIILEKPFPKESLAYGNFKYYYEIDFSELKDTGKFFIKIANQKSYPFIISESVFDNIKDSLILFFKVQRCGPTNPLLHQPCHLSDATKLIGYKDSSSKDLTGGWHDAGDYIKFMKTAAYTTYLLVFSYEFDKEKFGFDNDKNNVPDVLEEAKVGLDWLLRCNFTMDKLVSQVQDERDHNVGFRLPENDTLQFDRPAFVSMGKNTIGIYVASLALAAKIWKDKFYDNDFSNRCLKVAEFIYSIRNSVPDIDSSYSSMYRDKSFEGKLALAAIELYNTTKNQQYLDDAINYGKKANSDFWWSYGDFNSLAHFRIAQYQPEFSNYIYKNLFFAKNRIDTLIFKEGLDYSWGTTNSLLGVSLQTILYKKLTGSIEFDSLNTFQTDYVLGRNPWGISFIYNIGSNFPIHLHSQIAHFNNGYLPGALSAGPAPVSIINQYKIERHNFIYDKFNSPDVKYFDDEMDFITNEPTLIGNATALFVFGNLGK